MFIKYRKTTYRHPNTYQEVSSSPQSHQTIDEIPPDSYRDHHPIKQKKRPGRPQKTNDKKMTNSPQMTTKTTNMTTKKNHNHLKTNVLNINIKQ